jgi:endonuclease/exonuclease/phosphatase family metal-dependent hydrolase
VKRLTKMSIAALAAVTVLNLSRPSPAAAPEWPTLPAMVDDGTLSVMTYNVKGLPFPLAQDRRAALAGIGEALRELRLAGRQPDVIVLQEAFTPEAKAIARRAGYAHVVTGADADTQLEPNGAGDAFLQQASWIHGEGMGRWLDSGLVILSDLPIVRVRSMVFPDTMCAGFDCLAAKGVVIAWVSVPGRERPLAIADTHFNARKAAGVGPERANRAFARQARAARDFISANVDPGDDLVFGGDFNIGKDKARILAARDLVPGGREASALADCSSCAPELHADVAAIRKRGKDKQFYRGALRLKGLEVPLGGARGRALSDHLGYVARYELN